MKSTNMLRRATLGALAAFATLASVGVAAADEITGAGSTFAQPIYTRWAEAYAGPSGDTLNYQGIGSGAGVTQVINRTVDFGATDVSVAPDRLAANQLMQFPTVIGAVVVSVNIPGVDGNNLKLTGSLIGDIYLGRVRMWNDHRIAALNPGVNLPALAIAPVYRADASGTTGIFTNYLSSVNLAFGTTTGAGTSVSWRAGIGAPGNAGVAGAIANTHGAIGYVEYAYVAENHMQAVQLQNRSGAWVRPTVEAFAAAAAQAPWGSSPNQDASMINTAGATSWPIVSATYVVVPTNPTDAGRARKMLQFFDWAWKNGQTQVDALHYISLPASVQNRARQRWCQVRAAGQAVWSGCH